MEDLSYNPAQSACFTGHRSMTEDELRYAVAAITRLVPNLAAKGIVHYYAGGALGFDLAAAVTILNLKQSLPQLSLTLALPCEGHMDKWRRSDRALFSRVMERADRTVYVSETYYRGCMQARNRYMVDRSALCIAYLTASRGGTYNTVSYAEKKGIPVIRLAGDAKGEQLRFL